MVVLDPLDELVGAGADQRRDAVLVARGRHCGRRVDAGAAVAQIEEERRVRRIEGDLDRVLVDDLGGGERGPTERLVGEAGGLGRVHRRVEVGLDGFGIERGAVVE